MCVCRGVCLSMWQGAPVCIGVGFDRKRLLVDSFIGARVPL